MQELNWITKIAVYIFKCSKFVWSIVLVTRLWRKCRSPWCHSRPYIIQYKPWLYSTPLTAILRQILTRVTNDVVFPQQQLL